MALRQGVRPWSLLPQAQGEMMRLDLPRIDAASGVQGAFPFGMFLLGMLLSGALGWVVLQLVKQIARRRRVHRAARASRAERVAASVLAAHGYAVLGRQVRQRWSLLADEQEVAFDLIADYLVEGDGTRWIAEVKTGERALDLHYGPTRRQMLEYRQAFGVEGVLLVDAEAQSVRRVRFREPPGLEGAAWGRFARPRLLWLGIGVALGALLTHSWPAAIASVAHSLRPTDTPGVSAPVLPAPALRAPALPVAGARAPGVRPPHPPPRADAR